MDKVIPIQAFQDNYIWLLMDHSNKTACCVDPGDAKPVVKFLTENGFNLVAILVTHHHYDHTAGIEGLLRHYSIPVYGPATETIPYLTHGLVEGDKVHLPEISAQFIVMDIPGHTAGHIAYYNEAMIFCGDTLFTAGCGRLFEGTAVQMCHSLSKITALGTNTQVYCGHEYTEKNLNFAMKVEPNNLVIKKRLATVVLLRSKNQPTVPSLLGEEKATNPFLRCENPIVKEAAEAYAKRKLHSSVEVFAQLRQWKDSF